MSAILKVIYSRDIEAYDYRQKPFNYYILHLVYSEGNNEVLKTYTYYEDYQVQKLINKGDNILFYRYLENGRDVYYITINVSDRLYNFRIEKHNYWTYDYKI